MTKQPSNLEKAIKKVALLCADSKCGSCNYNSDDHCLLAETKDTPDKWLGLINRYKDVLEER